MTNSKKGFTLIELLTVVGIIAVMSVVGGYTYTNISKQSRDNRRLSDLRTIELALESYFQKERGYPINLGGLSPTFIPAVPKDPQSGNNYVYMSDENGNCFHMAANLETEHRRLSEASWSKGINNCEIIGDFAAAAATRCFLGTTDPGSPEPGYCFDVRSK